MIRLNEYIDIKQNPNQYILEKSNGKSIWRRIKDWFKNLFSDDDHIKYNRWADWNDYDYYDYQEYIKKYKNSKTVPKGLDSPKVKQAYEETLKNDYNAKYLKMVKMDPDEGRKCIVPNGILPDEKKKTGLYKFTKLYDSRIYSNQKYAGLFYKSEDIKDCAALFCYFFHKKKDTVLVIRQFQCVDVFVPYLKNKEIIERFIKFIKSDNEYSKIKELWYYSNYDEDNKFDTYDILHKECGFEEKTENYNYADKFYVGKAI